MKTIAAIALLMVLSLVGAAYVQGRSVGPNDCLRKCSVLPIWAF